MTPVLQITGVQKRYQSLRPLRIQELTIAAAERVAVSGFDAGAAEVLVNLVTGASLPDQGEVRVLGHRTADIVGGDEWLASLDRFGIVSPRGVLLEARPSSRTWRCPSRSRSTRCRQMWRPACANWHASPAFTTGTGVKTACSGLLERPAPAIRARVHLARAIALRPALLVLEHAGAELEADERLRLPTALPGVAEATALRRS